MRKEPKPEDIKLGERIQRVRIEFANGVDPARFAEPLGVTRQAVVNWERGHGAGRASLKKIALVYDVDFNWLATGVGSPRGGTPGPGVGAPHHGGGSLDVNRPSSRDLEGAALKAKLGDQFATLLQAPPKYQNIAIQAIDGIIQSIPLKSRTTITKEKSSSIRT